MRILLILFFFGYSNRLAFANDENENQEIQEAEKEASSEEEIFESESPSTPENLSVEQIDNIIKDNIKAQGEDASSIPQDRDVFGEVIRYIEEEEYLIEQEKKSVEQDMTKNFSERVRDFHTSMSENIVAMADTIDSFFINKTITDGRNRTNVRLTNISNWVERNGVNNDFDFKLRLRLPHLRKKIQIEFEDDSLTDDTVAARDNLTQNVSTNRTNRSNQQGGSRGALSFYQKFIGLETKLSSGVEFHSGFVFFARFRLSKDFILTPKQKITFIHDVFDDTRDNKGQIGVLNYDYTFNKSFLLRFANEENYRDINNTFQTTHGFSLYQQLSERNFISYNYRAESVNPEARSTFFLNSHVLNVSFRRRLYREHLYYETGPGMIFPKILNFEGQWAFIFKLEVIFGNI